MTHDLVIRGGTIVDGSGLAAYPADLAVNAGRITAIGRIREPARKEIDAQGHVVTPGFVDGHTHMDAQLHWDPLGTSSCYHGVTSVVMGNCGFTLAPGRKDARQLVVRNLERAEDISPVAMEQGIKWEWETFPEYLDVIERLPMSINYAPNIGHSPLRTWTMGEKAFESEASDDEIKKMEDQIRASMKAGAYGLTTSIASAHATADGRPVASRLASWEEMRRLVCTAGAEGGMFEIGYIPPSDPDTLASLSNKFRALAVESGAPMTFGLVGPENWIDGQLDMIESTIAAGGRMFGQSHSRGVNMIMSFETALPFDRLPEWSKLRAKPLAEQKRLLRDPDLRRTLVHEANHADYGQAIGVEQQRKPDWTLMRAYSSPLPPHPLVSDLAKERGLDPADLMIELALETDMKQMFMSTGMRISEELLLKTMRHPRAIMTFSDSGAHVSQIIDSSIQTYLLAYWTRTRGDFTLEEAVRMITLAPARAWGIQDRGLLREGMVADINVFNPVTLTPCMPEVVNDLPGGGRRLTVKAKGFRATVVAGEVALENGEPTGVRSGQLLRRGRPALKART